MGPTCHTCPLLHHHPRARRRPWIRALRTQLLHCLVTVRSAATAITGATEAPPGATAARAQRWQGIEGRLQGRSPIAKGPHERVARRRAAYDGRICTTELVVFVAVGDERHKLRREVEDERTSAAVEGSRRWLDERALETSRLRRHGGLATLNHFLLFIHIMTTRASATRRPPRARPTAGRAQVWREALRRSPERERDERETGGRNRRGAAPSLEF